MTKREVAVEATVQPPYTNLQQKDLFPEKKKNL